VALAALGGSRLVHGSLISRTTEPDTYAVVGTCIGITMIVGLFLPAGAASAAAKFIAYHRGRDDDATARAVYRALSRLGLAAAAALGAAAGLAAAAGLDLTAADAAAVAALAASFSLYSVAKAALYGFGRVRAYARLEVAASAVAVAATVAVVVTGSVAYLAPLVLGYAMLAGGAWWILRQDPADAIAAVRVGAATRRELAGYVALASIGAVAGAGFLQGMPVLATSYAEPLDVAHVVAAVTLVAPLYFLPRALGMALFPTMAQAWGAGDVQAVRHHLDLFTRALLALLAPVFVAALFVAEDALTAFGGAGYAGGATVLRLLLAGTYLMVVAVAAINALSSGEARRVWTPVGCAVAGCAVGLGATALLGEALGATGVGAAYLAGVAVTAGGPIVAVWRRHRMSWFGPLGRALALVAGALATAAALDAVTPGTPVRLGAALAGGAVATAVLHRDITAVVRAGRRMG
jgi:O-antigen/teichoic acid export membrane protein